jgi:hypothetical protein
MAGYKWFSHFRTGLHAYLGLLHVSDFYRLFTSPPFGKGDSAGNIA